MGEFLLFTLEHSLHVFQVLLYDFTAGYKQAVKDHNFSNKK